MARPRRRRRTAILVAGIVILLLIIGLFVADAALRAYAEDRVEGEIRDRLPATAEGDIDVRLGGASVILQYLGGSFERVDLEARGLTLDGVPVEASAVATGVPVDRSEPVERVVGTVTLTEAAVNTLVEGSAGVPADIRIGDGTVGYASDFRVFGFELTYDVTAEPRIEGDTVVLSPTGATLASGQGSLDIGDALGGDFGSLAVPVCVAEFLPEGVVLTDLELAGGELTATLESTGLMLTDGSLGTLGSCGDGA